VGKKKIVLISTKTERCDSYNVYICHTNTQRDVHLKRNGKLVTMNCL